MTNVAGWITAISVLVIALALTVGLVAAAIVIRKSLARLTEVANPAIKRAEATLSKVEEIAGTVEETMEDVSRKVKSTTSVIEDAVKPPLIGISSMLAGVSKGLQVWSETSKRGGNSKDE